MKTKALILAGLALAALVSCNKEKNESPFGDGDNAYLSVQIAYANGTATRGTGDSTNPFYYGEANENAVATADFYFYMSDGTFFSHVKQSISGTGKTPAAATTENIEWLGNGVVVLRGLTSTSSPAYMSVVLNGSTTLCSALEGKSITEAHETIKTDAFAESSTSGWSNFTMTSTVCKDAALGDNYCVKLTSNMFKDTEAAAAAATGADVVEAFVERIAAKVSVDITASSTTLTGGETIYKIGDFELNNATGTTKALYLKVHGWGLNATTKDSYSFKNIDPSWSFGTATIGTVTVPEFVWNDATNHRSYWAKSTNYDDATLYYPRSFNNDNATSMNYSGYTGTMPLNYVSYNDCAVALKAPAYCRENTNTETILDAGNFNTTATCALLTAQVVDETGTPMDLVLYENKYWTLDGYKARVLAKYASEVPYVSAGVKAAESNLEIVDANDGLIYVKFADGTYYSDATATAAITTADLAAKWPRANTEGLGYNQGMMHYSIPIEHLRGAGTYEAKNLLEADYGVVRNHWYNLTISKIANLGRGVWNPDEQIVPDDNDAKKYYVAAKINILSWKVVKQNVEL